MSHNFSGQEYILIMHTGHGGPGKLVFADLVQSARMERVVS